MLKARGIQISMDGKRRCLDTVFVERLWRSLKYEEVYLNPYNGAREAKNGIERHFMYFNNERPHQSLGQRTPMEVYLEFIPEQLRATAA